MNKLKVDLTPTIKRLEIVTRNLVTTKFVGNYKSVFKGRGLEFESYREYTQSDDAELIDWKATVRANKTLIKEFVEERNINIFFLIDASASMVLGSIPKLKSEYAAELVASLSYAILSAGDSVGFALFADKVVKEIRCTNGMKQFYALSQTVVNPDLYGGTFDFGESLRFLSRYLKESTLVIIVSDFIIPGNDWEEYLKMAARKFDIIGIMVRDPTDITLPRGIGQVVVSDPFSNQKMIIEPNVIGDDYEKEVRREINRIRGEFLKSNSDFLQLTTNKPFLNPLIKLFELRKTKWR
ncbi:MAG: DUF58 domain-containing protein [Nanoarchaeota archaeon]|nr:DUF58 domain-containing protein [Nanoarchaeota archaeon]